MIEKKSKTIIICSCLETKKKETWRKKGLWMTLFIYFDSTIMESRLFIYSFIFAHKIYNMVYIYTCTCVSFCFNIVVVWSLWPLFYTSIWNDLLVWNNFKLTTTWSNSSFLVLLEDLAFCYNVLYYTTISTHLISNKIRGISRDSIA